MTLEAMIARPLMALADSLSPASRAEWSVAMRQEFEALSTDRGALGWAVGCLAISLGWRMRAEAPFGLAVVVTNLAGWWLLGHLIFGLLVDWFYPNWVEPMVMAETLLKGCVAFGLALAWPRRAILAGLIVPLTWSFGATTDFFLFDLGRALQDPWTTVGNHPAVPTLVFPLMFLGQQLWTSLLGAGLGSGLSRIWRGDRTAAA